MNNGRKMNNFILGLTFLSLLGCGLVAGIFFAFSNFVMKSLGRLPPAQGIAAMQNINVDVINGGFMLVFMGTALCCLVVAVSCLFHWGKPGIICLLAGSLLYLVGTILVTMVFNVPLNNTLAAVDPTSVDAMRVWSMYLKSWVAWNHVRAIAALAATACFGFALIR
jgi:uncharacterized membrane protein